MGERVMRLLLSTTRCSEMGRLTRCTSVALWWNGAAAIAGVQAATKAAVAGNARQ